MAFDELIKNRCNTVNSNEHYREENPKRIAILVPNTCNPDYRVIKHAEFFTRAGYDVCIFCRWGNGLPMNETINGIRYIRKPITSHYFLRAIIQRKLPFLTKYFAYLFPNKLVAARKQNSIVIEEFDL